MPNQISRQQVRATLRRAANHPAPLRKYVEVEISGSNAVQVGCLLLGHERPNGEPGYYAAILTEDAFPSCGYVSIALSRESGKSIISELHADGWHDLTATQAGINPTTRLALAALEQVPDSQGRSIMRVDDLRMNPKDEPPEDAQYMRRMKLVLRGKLVLTKATASASQVALFDSNFSAHLRPEIISIITERLKGERIELVVYWDGTRFVSSDDYYAFAAYQSLSTKQLPVVIMGEFPQNAATVERQGGSELLPPLLVLRNKVMPGRTKELLAWEAQEQALRAKRLLPPSDLMVSWISLAETLGEGDVNERELHDFLTENPIIMGAQWDSVQSEVSLGKEYKADFVLRAMRALPTVRLVELERASHRLFTKDLHETDEVTHAVQQVSDWLRWWRQNPQNSIVAPSRGIDPEGLIVIGRSVRMSEREREALAHNNQRRTIKVITYDELLDDFGSLILHRLDDTRA